MPSLICFLLKNITLFALSLSYLLVSFALNYLLPDCFFFLFESTFPVSETSIGPLPKIADVRVLQFGYPPK